MLNLPKECQSQRYPPPLPFPPLERKLHPPCNTPLHSIFEARHHRPLKFPEYLPINHHPLPSPPFRGFPPPPPFAWLVHFSLSSLVGALGGVSPSAAYKSLGLRAPVSPTLDPKLGSLFLLGRRAGSKKHGRACYRVRAGGIAAILRPWVTPWGHPRDPAGSVRLAMGTRWVRSSATFRCSEWADKSDDGIFSLVYSGRMEGEGD